MLSLIMRTCPLTVKFCTVQEKLPLNVVNGAFGLGGLACGLGLTGCDGWVGCGADWVSFTTIEESCSGFLSVERLRLLRQLPSKSNDNNAAHNRYLFIGWI